MVTDRQVRKLRKLVSTGYTLERGAVKAAMGETTARTYMNSEKLPGELKVLAAPGREAKGRAERLGVNVRHSRIIFFGGGLCGGSGERDSNACPADRQHKG